MTRDAAGGDLVAPVTARTRPVRWAAVVLIVLTVGCTDGGDSVVRADAGDGTTVVPDDRLVACQDAGPGFPASAFDGPADAEARPGPVGDALRTFLGDGSTDTEWLADTGWRTLHEDDAMVLLGAGEPPSLQYLSLEPDGDGWSRSGGGECTTRSYREGLSGATWEPATAPASDTVDLDLLVTETGCASGQPPGDRLQPAEVVEDATAVTVTFRVEPLGGDCPGNPATPVTVTLDAPLGDRALVDGGPFPGRVVRPGAEPDATSTAPLPLVEGSPSSSSPATTAPVVVPTGPGPDDDAAVRDEIDQAFHTAFDAGIPEQDRFAAVEDGPALLAAGRQAAARFPEAAASISVTVHDIAFADASHARVTFELTYDEAMPLGPRAGEAVLIDGVWKVSRTTRCALIEQAGVACP